MITLPTDAVTGLLANVGSLIGDFWPLVAIALAVPFTFMIIHYVIGLFRSRGRK